VTRLTFALALLAGGLGLAQPNTYFAPIIARTPGTSPVGAVGMGTAIWLPDPGVAADQSLLFGTGGGTAIPFVLATQAAASVTGLPTRVDAIAAAPGVLVGGSSKTLLAVLSNGQVTFGTVESGAYVSKGPLTPISAGTVIALSAVPGGSAALLLSDGFQISRFELDVSSGTVVVRPGATMSAAPSGANDQANTLVFDGMSNRGFVGGRVLGDIYQFDARLDAGLPTVFDVALVSQGRLAAPVTGLALYAVPEVTYLLAANGQGLTIYNVDAPTPASSGFRVIPNDAVGPITAPAGVAVTNLPVGVAFPDGVIAVGDRTHTDLALLRWDLLATQVDGGLVIDSTFDPRDAGSSLPDGGRPDGGTDGGSGGGGGGSSGGGGPLGPGIPVDHGSSCTSAAGTPLLLLLLAGLGLVPRRRQRR